MFQGWIPQRPADPDHGSTTHLGSLTPRLFGALGGLCYGSA